MLRIIFLSILSVFALYFYQKTYLNNSPTESSKSLYSSEYITTTLTPTIKPTASASAVPSLSRDKPKPSVSAVHDASRDNKPTPTPDTGPWGVAKQVGEHTWTMKIQLDSRMSTPKELFDALNAYRVKSGVSALSWDDKLANYAQSRADFFTQNKNLDSHKGFEDYLNNQDGFAKLGFDSLGENASYGYRLLGVHLIEWIYAGDEPHDHNQLNTIWNYVGVGINGTSSCLIFGTGKH